MKRTVRMITATLLMVALLVCSACNLTRMFSIDPGSKQSEQTQEVPPETTSAVPETQTAPALPETTVPVTETTVPATTEAPTEAPQQLSVQEVMANADEKEFARKLEKSDPKRFEVWCEMHPGVDIHADEGEAL